MSEILIDLPALQQEIADLKTELREANEIIASCIRESGWVGEKNATWMAVHLLGENDTAGIEKAVKDWRGARSK